MSNIDRCAPTIATRSSAGSRAQIGLPTRTSRAVTSMPHGVSTTRSDPSMVTARPSAALARCSIHPFNGVGTPIASIVQTVSGNATAPISAKRP